MKRLIVALFFFPLFYLLVTFHSPLLFFFFAASVSSFGLLEFYRLFFREGKKSILVLGELLSILLMGGFYLKGTGDPFPSSLLLFVFSAVFILFLSVHLLADLESFFLSVSIMGTGLVYVSWFLGHLVLIRMMDQGALLIFLLAMITWGTDSGALFTGKLIGKRKLAPTISPNKTIEGAMGGLVFGVLTGMLARYWFLPGFSLIEIASLAFFMSIAGQTGDLVESMFKRANQVKDSSRLLPGHGGILDKIDSFIFTAPVLYYYLIFFKPV
ncbi:MAG: phosphatidate cytidylyltransferase [Nitrospirae bacterium]|nr:phosphatidate cytidylyltransferase [Nitrospirota bacterium]